jgi:outer membrane protein OmpA-like peptidoglycan-associated protein
MSERANTFLRSCVKRAGRALPLCTALTLAACGAAVPPKELMDARSAYTRVEKGPAANLAPAELDTAKQALARAEGYFNDDGDSPNTRDQAYIAERKALAAEAQAGLVQAERDRASVDEEFRKAQLATIDKTKAELDAERRAKEATKAEVARTQDEVARQKDEVARQKDEVAKTKADLAAEKKAREDAEKRAAAAMASLAEVAKVKEEARGVVITLSGSVLFATGKSDLLPIAKDKLSEVAKALKDQGFKAIVVEGHTDSVGSATKNEELSLKRATSVREHLVSQGIPAEKIKAVGLGSSRPVAENNTPDGRANNRRVEIVVTPDR